jgi:hypothetical protein
MTHENRKKLRNFMFGSAGCSFLRAEGFSIAFDVLRGGNGGKIAILIEIIILCFQL